MIFKTLQVAWKPDDKLSIFWSKYVLNRSKTTAVTDAVSGEAFWAEFSADIPHQQSTWVCQCSASRDALLH